MKSIKFGFTLSEVLITLAIIGVVAAITIPILNQTTNNEQFKAGAYKNVSVLNNAIRRCYAFDSKKLDEFLTAIDLKKEFFGKHINVMDLEKEFPNNWPENIQVETTFYLTDGTKYGISEKITDSCPYDIKNKEENVPCFFVFFDTNGEKKPNKLTESTNFYKDINTVYVYEDRFILQPGEIEYADDEGDVPDPPSGDENNNNNDSNNNNNNNDDDGDDDDDDEPEMKRCLEKRSYEECVKFCQKNGYHSALCK